MSTSSVECVGCGVSSPAVEWGFVLLAQHGWVAELGETDGAAPAWRCPACAQRHERSALGEQREAEGLGSRLRVLLVDDQLQLLRVTADLLHELDIVTAGSGREALEILERDSSFDVVVSDVAMPDLDGLELFMRVRENHSRLAGQFLLLSGDPYRASERCARMARREGLRSMPRVLGKPVPRDELFRAICEVGRRLAGSATPTLVESSEGAHAVGKA